MLSYVVISFGIYVFPLVLSCNEDMDPALALGLSSAANMVYNGATVLEGTMELVEDEDPSGICKGIKTATQFAKIGLAVAKNELERCYQSTKFYHEKKFHENYMKQMTELNDEMDKATRKLVSKFSDMEKLIENVTSTVTVAIDSIKAVHIREAKEVFKEVMLDFEALMMEFKLNKEDNALKLFYGLCNSARQKDPESVIRRMLSIMKMENNPFLIIAESRGYTDSSVFKYLTTVTLACGQLARAVDVCLQHRGKGMAKWTMDRHIMRRNKFVQKLAESLNEVNKRRESLYFTNSLLDTILVRYINASRGYNAQISHGYTLFYMDNEEFLLRRKFIYSLEFDGQSPIAGPLTDPAWVIGYNYNYIRVLETEIHRMEREKEKRRNIFLIRTEISDPDIFVPITFRDGIQNYLKAAKYKTQNQIVTDILTAFGCSGGGDIFAISVYAVEIPANSNFQYPFYGFGKCYSSVMTREAGMDDLQVVSCFLLDKECKKDSVTILDLYERTVNATITPGTDADDVDDISED